MLVGRLSLWTAKDSPLLFYLFKCFERLSTLSSLPLAKECRYFVLSYVGLVLLMPEMFQEGSERLARLGAGLLPKVMAERPEMVPPGLLPELIGRYVADEQALLELVEGMLGWVQAHLAEASVLDPCGPVLNVVEQLLSIPALASALPHTGIWCPEEVGAADLGTRTWLGAMLSVGPTPKALDSLLPLKDQSGPAEMNSAFSALSLATQAYTRLVHSALLRGIKASPVFKEALLAFFARLAALNADRAKMRYDVRKVSPDVLVLGAFRVLLCFCEPFLAPNSPKAELIDPAYYEASDRLPTDGLTKISMLDADYERYKAEYRTGAKVPNFVSEAFYLAVHYFRIGYVAMISSMSQMEHIRRDLQAHIDSHPEVPSGNALAQMQRRRVLEQLEQVKGMMRCHQMTLLDTGLVEEVYLLVLLMLSKLLAWSAAGPMGELPAVPEARFTSLPEHWLESATEVLLFLSRTLPRFWKTTRPVEPLVRLIATFLDRAEYIRNPYLRSKLVDILHGWAIPDLEQVFDAYPILAEHLAPKLMRFYIEVERTGASSQFYDKFNIRYAISAILHCIWEHPVYRERLRAEAQTDRSTFIHFINFILNDVSFLLDETRMKLIDIHQHQLDTANGTLAALPVEERQAREESFRKTEGMCTAYAQLGGETLSLLAYLTAIVQRPFLQDEVIDHFAAMLNYNLVQLTGPKCGELKVRDPERYHFRPRQWLDNLVRTFLNFDKSDVFLRALARDARSFNRDTFRKALALITRLGLCGSDAAEAYTRFDRMIERVQTLQVEGAQAEADLGDDIPEDFLDPLMATLMEDPVILTTSGTTVDRKTIVAHLLNHQIDPFNRMPITMEQVIPDTELKARITAFLKEKRQT